MIPPQSSSTLSSNPKFATLYTHITTNLLNPDGSTKDTAYPSDSDAEKVAHPDAHGTDKEDI